MKGLVMMKNADKFTVLTEKNEEIVCIARKNLKKDGVFVGDKVVLDENFAIFKLEKRKNCLVRPPLSNIDKMFIILAPIPKPDFYTVDKLLIFCAKENIEPIVCVNKSDLAPEFCKKIEKKYKKIAKTLVFSTFDESVFKIKRHLSGICVLAGQSAVGKSSIVNALKKEQVALTDTFSKKVERGKQTTRLVRLYRFGKDKFLADTAGFSKLDEKVLDLDERKVKNFYIDFQPFAEKCKYSTCLHLGDKDCAVSKAVKEGKIDKERYENYKKLVQNLKNIKKY